MLTTGTLREYYSLISKPSTPSNTFESIVDRGVIQPALADPIPAVQLSGDELDPPLFLDLLAELDVAGLLFAEVAA